MNDAGQIIENRPPGRQFDITDLKHSQDLEMRYSIRKERQNVVNILCAENTQTFGNSSYKNLIGKAGLAGCTDTVSLDFANGDLRVKQSYILPVMVSMSFMSILYIIVINFQV